MKLHPFSAFAWAIATLLCVLLSSTSSDAQETVKQHLDKLAYEEQYKESHAQNSAGFSNYVNALHHLHSGTVVHQHPTEGWQLIRYKDGEQLMIKGNQLRKGNYTVTDDGFICSRFSGVPETQNQCHPAVLTGKGLLLKDLDGHAFFAQLDARSRKRLMEHGPKIEELNAQATAQLSRWIDSMTLEPNPHPLDQVIEGSGNSKQSVSEQLQAFLKQQLSKGSRGKPPTSLLNGLTRLLSPATQ